MTGESNHIVADISELVQRNAGAGEDVVDGDHLVRLALVDELEAEILGADSDGSGFALGDEADAQAAEPLREGDPQAVVGSKTLHFQPVPLSVGAGQAVIFGDEEELAVGQDAIDVKDENLDAAGAIFRG